MIAEIKYPGRWWRALDDGRIECLLCPRRCKLRDGQRGFCFVRQADAGRIVLTTYGRSSGFCIDPIEKKPLNQFYPGSAVLSFGTAGCNLGCRFCQNWDISKARQMDRLADRASPESIARAAADRGCRSVAFTYNDPVIFAEYALDTAAACRALGVKTVAVTAGYIDPCARADFFAGMDAANVDLKAFTEEFYRKQCFAALAPVLDTIEFIRHETRTWLEITTLLIPGLNDSDAELDRLTDWVAAKLGPDVPLHFTAFHPAFDLTALPPTPASTLVRARRVAMNKGLRYVYTGNVHDTEGSSTYCPGCGKVVIERNGYDLGDYRIRGGRCAHCSEPIAGHFEDRPDSWGSNRQTIRMS